MDAKSFAECWQEDWNSHDLDRILSHYTEDIVFRSNKAVPIAGTGELIGKPALRKYWAAALDRQPDLAFRVRDVFHGYHMMVITYVNQRGVLAAETLYFDETGRVYRAAACHGEPGA
ncbi:nuclear transport factor 2 family protein [Thalassococcus sp. S3]|uniref:nuclear transport factor 2 family protein n=1 Tax=Thalassococcus sp. S3 TaxID=2017482 RepID=UPI0010243B28|nr:nuclear transport factor 2 family protein [Thalassococcus sp. S3]QBF33789.1 hypothetical protein CFI11_21615 [Thalassococcus sp. S3]